jgi:thioredoxin-like negative regulator of GroEL
MNSIAQMMKKVMKNKRVWLYMLIFIFSHSFLTGQSEENRINWLILNTVDATSLNGKPGMLYFYASSVKSFSPTEQGQRPIVRRHIPFEVMSNENVVALSRKFVCVGIDFDYRPHLFAKFGVVTFPTVIFTDPWGNVVSRCTGFVSADVLISLMKVFPTDFTKAIQWNETLEKDKKSFEALNGMADFYFNLKAWELSNQFYNKALKTENAQENQEVKESILLVIGLNELRMKDYKKAQRAFENCIKEVRQGKESDKAMLGMIIAQLGQGKISNAEKTLTGLKSRYPESPAILQAERYIRSVRNSKK